jgi:thymidylate synthase
MNRLDNQYLELLETIIRFGVDKKDRTGTGTKSIFGYTIRHNMKTGFPLLTTKKMAWKSIVTELLWFLKGRTDLRYLLENDCHIWTGDALKNYNKHFQEYWNGKYGKLSEKEFEKRILDSDEFAEKFGDLGKIYGFQWRNWNGEIDQISELIKELKSNPDSRRLLISAWNPSDLPHQVLPPCHYGFQVYTRELTNEERIREFEKRGYIKNIDPLDLIPTRAISLMWGQRSVDTGLGLSFNIASYGLLLMMIAKQVNMVPDELIGNLGDVHLYLNHIEPIKEQLTREPYELPTVKISDRVVNDISEYTLDDIILENYQSHPTIKMPLSN